MKVSQAEMDDLTADLAGTPIGEADPGWNSKMNYERGVQGLCTSSKVRSAPRLQIDKKKQAAIPTGKENKTATTPIVKVEEKMRAVDEIERTSEVRFSAGVDHPIWSDLVGKQSGDSKRVKKQPR
ncbi:hypothetical protein QFC20_005486 [Naganishia adeliensis]|uniref:Uncharacterized protein n=1 Tax=Naganishia adeliensis TaxID=92952 RepID=A0ACC2VMP2_9TREE|nr:hypothetical protein QFC20_005486 [Naganishia adeliensis]